MFLLLTSQLLPPQLDEGLWSCESSPFRPVEYSTVPTPQLMVLVLRDLSCVKRVTNGCDCVICPWFTYAKLSLLLIPETGTTGLQGVLIFMPSHFPK